MIILSNHLTIVDLVSHYLTNYLIVHRPLPNRPKALIRRSHAVLANLSTGYPSVWGAFPCVTQLSAARRQISFYPRKLQEQDETLAAARLACIRHAASIHPEPGSNSPLNATLTDRLLKKFDKSNIRTK